MKSSDSLRKSIVKYALEGNLSHRSNDDARSFFDALVAAGNRTKECSHIVRDGDKYFEIIGKDKKEITDDIPFRIPDSWLWCRFEDICDFCIGKTPERKTSAYWNSNDIPWVSIADMRDNSHITTTKESISYVAKNECFSFEPFAPGSMLMSFKLTIGKTTIVDMPCYCNEAIMRFEPFLHEDIFRSFLFMFIGFLAREIRVTDAIKGSTLNKKKLAKMLIPLPPLKEQREIIEKIHRIDPLIEEFASYEEEKNILIERLPIRMIKSIIKYELDEKNSKASTWKKKRLADIGEIVGGGTPDTSTLRYWDNGTVEWITPADMNSNLNYELPSSRRKITLDGLNESSTKLMNPGAIIMSSRAPIGYLGINKVPTCTSQGCKSLVISDTKKYLNKFVYFAIYNALPDIISAASTMTFKEISGTKFGEITINIPDFDEQKRIVDKIEKMLGCIGEIQ